MTTLRWLAAGAALTAAMLLVGGYAIGTRETWAMVLSLLLGHVGYVCLRVGLPETPAGEP